MWLLKNKSTLKAFSYSYLSISKSQWPKQLKKFLKVYNLILISGYPQCYTVCTLFKGFKHFEKT